MTETPALRLHEDAPLFREAVNFTAAQTGFAPRLIEKDYFCTVLLQYLEAAGAGLVFRGGTCLAKVHVGFYRLSEDLDFLVPTPIDASRAARRRMVARAKDAVARIREAVPSLRVVTALTGANDSRQYAAVIGYATLVSANEETVKIEVGLREPVLTRTAKLGANTLLLDPVTGSAAVSPVPVACLSSEEALAEKLRAALSRREVAIRDFYDVDHMIHVRGAEPHDPALGELVRQKLRVPGNAPVDVSASRWSALQQQLESELRPVLREGDFQGFDLRRAFAAVSDVAAAVAVSE